ASGQITQIEPLPFAVEPGDQLEIRPDCDGVFAICRDEYGNQLNFKGENLIPIGQASDTPGAGVPGSAGGGSTYSTGNLQQQ
ncbi:phage BR0599 family protein, partial [Microbulbifer sp. OS29]